MTLRYARHTTDLKKMEAFYTELVGLENLGGFENHDGYDGLFLGHKHASWHIEFTTSTEKPTSKFDDEDLLVFYVNSDIELQKIKNRIEQKQLQLELSKNPYWTKNAIMVSDPDGFKVAFSIQPLYFNANDELTTLIKNKGIDNWGELLEFVRNLPYGRNKNRSDFSLVIKEGKGSCSAKHALLKKIADLNKFNEVKLILGMFKMNNLNTLKIGNVITENELSYIPEAHCYLKLNNQRIDVTGLNADTDNLQSEIIEEIEIEPEQVIAFKVDYHKKFLKKWIIENHLALDFDSVWAIREQCIKNLEAHHL